MEAIKHAFYANLGCRHLRAKSLASLGCAPKRAFCAADVPEGTQSGPLGLGTAPCLLFLLAKVQEIPLGISNETGRCEAAPAREAGVFKMKEFHFERVLEKEAKRRMTIRFQ